MDLVFGVDQQIVLAGLGNGIFAQAQPLGSLVYGLGKALEAEGLEQVVDHVELVALDGVVGIGRRKNHSGFFLQAPQEFHARQLGHLDVEENQVDRLCAQYLQGFEGIGTLSHPFELRQAPDVVLQQRTGQFLVVDHQASDRVHARFRFRTAE